MALPVVSVVKPSSIRGLRPDQIGPCNTTPVFFPGAGWSALNPMAARAWNAMVVAVLADSGLDKPVLTAVSVADVLRTYDTQVRAFLDRYTTTYTEGVNVPLKPGVDATRVWNGTTYYLKLGKIPCATPGQGYHPLGLAVDVAVYNPAKFGPRPANIHNHPALFAWLVKHAGEFGWSWENPTPGVDDAHLHYFAGDALPQRVLDIEAFLAASK